MPLADAAAAAAQNTQAATPDPASTGDKAGQAAAKGTDQAKAEPAPTLFFHKKEAKEAVDLETLDPTKLPAEVQPFYKSMQADYTRKTQAVADMRRQIEAEQKAVGETRKLLEDFLGKVAQGKTETPPPVAQPDIMEEIKALRENGDHDAADRKLMEFWEAQQKAATEPLKRDAEIKNLQATFRETASATMMNDPIVKQYPEYVVQSFDADSPMMNRVRQDILSTPERAKFYTPMIMRMLAYEAHIRNLETVLAEKVDSLVAERIKAERAKAAGVPAKLVSSGATTKQGERPRMSLAESTRAALESLTSG